VRIKRNQKAFSLVEVVLALGIFVFAGFALIGLLGVGLQNTRDSREQLQAATLAEFLCSTRRAAPTNSFSGSGSSNPEPGFPLPALTSSSNNISPSAPIYLSWDGISTNQASASFGLFFRITAPANYVASVSPGNASVYLCFFWPAQASPSSPNTGRYELTTSFLVP